MGWVSFTPALTARIERERIELASSVEPRVLLALAAQDFAGKLQAVQSFTITPDMIGTLLTDALAKKAS